MALFSFHPDIGDLVSVRHQANHHRPARILDFRAADIEPGAYTSKAKRAKKSRNAKRSKNLKKEDLYLVHYAYCDERWDEWVPISRLSKEKVRSEVRVADGNHRDVVAPTEVDDSDSQAVDGIVSKQAKRKLCIPVNIDFGDKGTALSAPAVYSEVFNTDSKSALNPNAKPPESKATDESASIYEGYESEASVIVKPSKFLPDCTLYGAHKISGAGSKRRNTGKRPCMPPSPTELEEFCPPPGVLSASACSSVGENEGGYDYEASVNGAPGDDDEEDSACSVRFDCEDDDCEAACYKLSGGFSGRRFLYPRSPSRSDSPSINQLIFNHRL